MPYLTVEEIRKHKGLVEKDNQLEMGGTRFVGSTDTNRALKYLGRDDTILECGPAVGTFTVFLQQQGYRHIHLLDFVNMLQSVDASTVESCHEIDFNIERMPYADNTFDAVTAWGIAEHLENPYHFMREVHRVLKDNGLFIMSVPSIFHIESRLLFLKTGMFPRWNRRNNHISVLPRGVFEKIFLRYFTVVETAYIKPSFRLNRFNRLSRYAPSNQWFGNYVVYVLKKKPFVPYKPS